jgi:cation:H+ antiporter
VSPALSLGLGLVLLAGGGECLVRGAARLATFFGISPLVIGLTVVAFGTSAPEMAVSLQAVRAGAGDLGIGNVVGSNIFNVLFILGVSALIAPLSVSRRVVWIEAPVMVGMSLLAMLLALDGRLDAAEGALLMGALALYTFWLIWAGRTERNSDPRTRSEPPWTVVRAGLVALVGLGVLTTGARLLVGGAVALATSLGVGDVVVGLTIVAAGTSLPEVAASVVATLRGEREIAIGNVLGSCIFNVTMILGSSAAVAGGLDVPPAIISFDLVVMLAVAVACLPIFFTGHVIARWEGGLFLAYYGVYTVYVVLDATQHRLLPHVQAALLIFALPLTVVTLAVLASRAAASSRETGRA